MKKIIKISLLLFIVFSVTSCGDNIPQGKDNAGFFVYKEECVSYHKEPYTFYIMVGKIMLPQTGYNDVCDSTIIVKHYINPKDIDKDWLDNYLSNNK